MTTPFALIDDGHTHQLEATLAGDSVRIAPAALQTALGWELKAEGLCRDEVCVPVPVPTAGRVPLRNDDGIDLAAFAELLGLPLALNVDQRAASLGRSAVEHASVLKSGEAPDFTLPDLNGTLHTLSDYRGKKVLLIAYASW